MIISKRNKQTSKQKAETDHGQEEQTWGFQGGKGRERDVWAPGGGWGLDVNHSIWNGWAMGSYCTEQGNVCDWLLRCAAELDETL